jgi:hypothetical protein
MRTRHAAALLGCLLAFGGCILPARSYGAYEEKAATTAHAVLSAVGVARYAVKMSEENTAFAAFVTTMLDEAEDDASSASSTFDSIQPPDERSQQLSASLEGIVEPAVKAITELRIAARGGHTGEFGEQKASLAKATEDLDVFLKDHT